MQKRFFWTQTILLILSALFLPTAALSDDPFSIKLKTGDLVYSPIDNKIYASVPNDSAVNPNTLTPIDPATGELGTPIPIGFNPGQLTISDDGTMIHVVFGGEFGVQSFDVVNQTLGYSFFIAGGPEVKEMLSIPGRPTAVLVSTHMPGFSPPATGTAVWEDGIKLPNQVGTGLGVGGPDRIAVDLADGSLAYGYQTTVTSFTNWNMVINENGVENCGCGTLQGILTGSSTKIARHAGRVFRAEGEVYNIIPAFQTGLFESGDNFVLDPGTNRFYTMKPDGPVQRIYIYNLTTLQLLTDITVSGFENSLGGDIRFGNNGFAFRNSEQVVIVPDDVVVGDLNLDGIVDLLDVQPFVDLIESGGYQLEGDINYDGSVNLLEVQLFVDLLLN